MNTETHSSNIDHKRSAPILIIDDQPGICRALEVVLRDDGYQSCVAADAEQAFEVLGRIRPALVLLDIWMPGMDGIELLKLLKLRYPELPVIMISGHATIATAVMATKLGAADFIEKPLDLYRTLAAVKRVLSQSTNSSSIQEAPASVSGASLLSKTTVVTPLLNSGVFSKQLKLLRGERVVQKTLAGSVVLYGQGLHSGQKSGLVLEPLPANSGIHFVGVSEPTAVPAHVDFVESTGFATTIRLGATQAGTIEHLMSALHAFGITNLLIKCNGEVPVMDGSALEFCSHFEAAGVQEQEGDWFDIRLPKSIRIGSDREFMQIEPADEFSVDYTLEYPKPVGLQRFEFKLGSVEDYKREIAPARTFGFVRDIDKLQKQGLALGGRFDNFVLFGEQGPINGALRFPDEAVRHKVLDAIGDLYLLGRRLRGKVTARMTGHSDNIAMLKAIREEMLR